MSEASPHPNDPNQGELFSAGIEQRVHRTTDSNGDVFLMPYAVDVAKDYMGRPMLGADETMRTSAPVNEASPIVQSPELDSNSETPRHTYESSKTARFLDKLARKLNKSGESRANVRERALLFCRKVGVASVAHETTIQDKSIDVRQRWMQFKEAPAKNTKDAAHRAARHTRTAHKENKSFASTRRASLANMKAQAIEREIAKTTDPLELEKLNVQMYRARHNAVKHTKKAHARLHGKPARAQRRSHDVQLAV